MRRIETEFAGDLVDGFAWFVSDEVFELWIGGVPERHGVECGYGVSVRVAAGRVGGRGREARGKHAHDSRACW